MPNLLLSTSKDGVYSLPNISRKTFPDGIKVCVLRDLEGDSAFLENTLSQYGIFRSSRTGRYVIPQDVILVNMGDVTDKGKNDLAVQKDLRDIFENYSSQCVYIIGNRDLTHLRFLDLLREDSVEYEISRIYKELENGDWLKSAGNRTHQAEWVDESGVSFAKYLIQEVILKNSCYSTEYESISVLREISNNLKEIENINDSIKSIELSKKSEEKYTLEMNLSLKEALESKITAQFDELNARYAPDCYDLLAKIIRANSANESSWLSIQRIKYLLSNGIGASGAFERRKKELQSLGKNSESIDVANSFISEILNGNKRNYLKHAKIASIIGNTLYIHGSFNPKALGINLSSYDSKGKIKDVTDFVDRINQLFARFVHLLEYVTPNEQDELNDLRKLFDDMSLPPVKSRTDGKTVISVPSYSDEGNRGCPTDQDWMELMEKSRIDTIVVGHQPVSQIYAVPSLHVNPNTGYMVRVINTDTSFSGASYSAVELKYEATEQSITISARKEKVNHNNISVVSSHGELKKFDINDPKTFIGLAVEGEVFSSEEEYYSRKFHIVSYDENSEIFDMVLMPSPVLKERNSVSMTASLDDLKEVLENAQLIQETGFLKKAAHDAIQLIEEKLKMEKGLVRRFKASIWFTSAYDKQKKSELSNCVESLRHAVLLSEKRELKISLEKALRELIAVSALARHENHTVLKETSTIKTLIAKGIVTQKQVDEKINPCRSKVGGWYK